MDKPRTVLVTGSTGLLGNNVVRKLIAAGQTVRAFVRSSSDRQPLEGLQVESVVGDVRDLDSLRRACRGASCVIHAAAIVRIGWSMSKDIVESNVGGTRNIVGAARESGARLIHISSVDALAVPKTRDAVVNEDSPPSGIEIDSNYAVTKRAADREVQRGIDRGLDATIVYPGFMLGPWDWKPSSGRMLLAVANRFTPLAPSGGCSLCDVRDVAAATVRAASGGFPQRRYILAGHNMTYFELWTRMARISAGRPPVARLGPIAGWIAGAAGDMGTRLRRSEGDINSAMLAMSRQFHYYDSSRAAGDLEYRPRDADLTIRDAWKWFCQHRPATPNP